MPQQHRANNERWLAYLKWLKQYTMKNVKVNKNAMQI